MPENLKGKVITRAAQKKLFENLIDTYVDRAKKYFDEKLDSRGNVVNWSEIDSDIKEILVDMSYRGELKSKLVKKIFDMVSGTEKSKLASFVGDPMSFKGIVENLPDKNRCKNRKEKLS